MIYLMLIYNQVGVFTKKLHIIGLMLTSTWRKGVSLHVSKLELCGKIGDWQKEEMDKYGTQYVLTPT